MKPAKIAVIGLAFSTFVAAATETENHVMRVLPAVKPIKIDGEIDDWNLSGGVFACGDVERMREQYAVWFHAMYDAENIYLLARWLDPTPMNNPETFGGHGWNGDCLQVRFILFPDTPEKTITWWTLWRDARGKCIADRSSPGPNNGVIDNNMPGLPDAAEEGVVQMFGLAAHGKGYNQEVMIPWKLLSVSGKVPQPGSRFRMTIEPNFTAGSFGRITIKDIFDAEVKSPNRVFTFRTYNHWGWAVLETSPDIEPTPVRLADSRAFPVSMQNGMPVVDWAGLISKFEWPGFKTIEFEMPFDGYVSLNIVNKDGVVARHLLNWDSRSAGKHTVQWDGLDDATYRTPGHPVPAGEYTWQALAHRGAKLTFRGFAGYGGKAPWESAPENSWLGDHGAPSAVVADDERVYLACNGAEGGRHLLAVDFQGNYIWGLQNTTGAADPYHIAIDGGYVYVLHPKAEWREGGGIISRVDAKSGTYAQWPDTKSHMLAIGNIWPEPGNGVDHCDGIDARNNKLYLSSGDPTFFVEDVADWKALIRKLRDESNQLAKRVMEAVDPRTCQKLDAFLADKEEQNRAFATWTGGPRFDRGVIAGLNRLLDATDVAPGTQNMPPAVRRHKNRLFLEQVFSPALQPLRESAVHVLDIQTGKVIRSWPVFMPTCLKAVSDDLVYVISGGTEVLALNLTDEKTATVIKGLSNASGIATDKEGRIYVSVGEPDMQVIVFNDRGREISRIGRRGGHARIGPWQPDGMIHPRGIAVDREGQLWVMEDYHHPKRVSVWDARNGNLIRDFFGPTQYGASGSAINPRDPNLMVGVACEWRLDSTTGRSVCLGAFDTTYHNFATFREGDNGRLYLFTNAMTYGHGDVKIWERMGDADFRLRAIVRNKYALAMRDSKDVSITQVWADINGDGLEQDSEWQTREGALHFAGSNSWSLNLGPDMALYGWDRSDGKLKVLPLAGFHANGAPRYLLDRLRSMPDAMSNGYEPNMSCAMPSADNRVVLINLRVKDHPAGYLWHGFDLASGRLLWTYPNPYFQVHGSHQAPASEPGLFRGAFGPIGAVAIKETGPFWIINGNLGEWNALTSSGFYLTRLFCGDLFKWKWPESPLPGADMTDLPPGCGSEDFGGSVTQSRDGRIFLQAGKMAIWNIEMTGLDSAVSFGGGPLTLSAEEVKQALAIREETLQAAAAGRKLRIKKATISFTGNFGADFRNAEIVDYRKTEEGRIRTALAYDDEKLYVGWEVRDATPWVNSAKDISQIYACGDTVDLQLGTDPNADPKRTQPQKGDIRISIGNFQGQPTAVLYRFVSEEKKPRVFTSGVIKGYQVDYVDVLSQALLQVKVNKDNYVVEIAMPFSVLGISPKPQLALRGDVGATHGDVSGERTKLRTHWSNQKTGLVDDVVFELQIAPQNWGEMIFE